jgi:hypothetical protein
MVSDFVCQPEGQARYLGLGAELLHTLMTA